MNKYSPISISKTPRYIAECKLIEENKNININITGVAQLIAAGPRDWLKQGESWDDLHRETYNYYYENGLAYVEELNGNYNKNNSMRCWMKEEETWNEYVDYLIKR